LFTQYKVSTSSKNAAPPHPTDSRHSDAGGWPGCHGNVVAKEYTVVIGYNIEERERARVEKLGQLCASGEYNSKLYLVMLQQPGVPFSQLPGAAQELAKGGEACKAYLVYIRGVVADAAIAAHSTLEDLHE
jgi:hypothetical protein